MKNSYALQFPAQYVVMDHSEMEYLEGGAIKRMYVQRAVDALAIVIAFASGQIGARLSAKAANAFLKKNKTKLVGQLRGKLRSMLTPSKAATVSAVIVCGIEVALTLAGSGIGDLVARGIDRADGHENNWCFE